MGSQWLPTAPGRINRGQNAAKDSQRANGCPCHKRPYVRPARADKAFLDLPNQDWLFGTQTPSQFGSHHGPCPEPAHAACPSLAPVITPCHNDSHIHQQPNRPQMTIPIVCTGLASIVLLFHTSSTKTGEPLEAPRTEKKQSSRTRIDAYVEYRSGVAPVLTPRSPRHSKSPLPIHPPSSLTIFLLASLARPMSLQ